MRCVSCQNSIVQSLGCGQIQSEFVAILIGGTLNSLLLNEHTDPASDRVTSVFALKSTSYVDDDFWSHRWISMKNWNIQVVLVDCPVLGSPSETMRALRTHLLDEELEEDR